MLRARVLPYTSVVAAVAVLASCAGKTSPDEEGDAEQRIAFVRPDRRGEGHIYVMAGDGTGQRRLTEEPVTGYVSDYSPLPAHLAWSPDGDEIAFDSRRDGEEIYVVGADGSDERRVAEDASGAAWSPDGDALAFYRAVRGNVDVYTMRADGSRQVRRTSHSAVDAFPTWSPDGERIAFASSRRGNTDIYVIDVDDTGERRLTSGRGDETLPAWSPDGDTIAFVRFQDNSDVYLMDADGGRERPLTRERTEETAPAWSPDGAKIAYTRDLGNGEEIFVVNRDGTARRRLTHNTARDLSPTWAGARE